MNKSYPNTRMRRNRSSNFIRNLIRETSFSVDDLIYPIFVLPGKNKEENIDSVLFKALKKANIKKTKDRVPINK